MLKKGINLIIVYVLVMLGCDRPHNNFIIHNDQLSLYIQSSFSSYQTIYTAANDSINKWINDSLQIVGFEFMNSYQLDSAMCFNKNKTRFFSAILDRDVTFKNSNSDQIREFGGAKIDGRWYFFFLSGSLVVPREHYQEDMYSPLSFEKLSEVAHKEIMQGALKKNKDGSYSPNDEFFEYWFPKTETDEKLLEAVKYNWSNKIDKKELLEIQAEMAKSIRPTEPVKKKSWWEKLFN